MCRASTSYCFIASKRRGWPGHKGVHARLRRAMPGNDECKTAPPRHAYVRIGPASLTDIYMSARARAREWQHRVMNAPNNIDEILENFALLDQWDDRYRY